MKDSQNTKKALEQMYDLIQDIGIVPMDTNKYKLENNKKENMQEKILVVDLKFLPSDLKQETTESTKEYLEEKYGHKVFLIDSSRSNVEGSSFREPVYFI